MANFVQAYKSTDLNAPSLVGAAKSLIYVLDAVLVNGYNSPNFMISLVGNGTTTTVTVASTANLVTGQTVTVAGASIGTMNGTFTITVATGTTFTYLSAGNGTSTGSPTYSPTLPISTITRSGTTATVTTSQNNSTLVTGNWVTVSGAAQTDYNGTFQITVLSGTQFTYQVANSPVTPATGTIVYWKAGLQWTKPFAGGTNTQSYRSADATSNKFYLQVIDNAATAGTGKEAQVYGAEVLTADSTPNNGGGAGSGQFPTTAQQASNLCWYKSSTADSTNARAWTIFGDDRTFYYNPWTVIAGGGRLYGFGHFIPYKSGDGYNTFISAESAFNISTSATGLVVGCQTGQTTSQTAALYVSRAYTQAGSALTANVMGTGFTGGGTFAMGGSGPALVGTPNVQDNGFYFLPVTLWECAAGPPLRGRMPGFYTAIYNAAGTHANYDMLTNITNLSGVTLTGIFANTSTASSTNLGYAFFDTFGPWN